jgi:hypothetical protein
MTGADIAALLIRFGPIAFDWIEELVKIWTIPMSPEEVVLFVKSKRKSYDEYIAAERASRTM